MLKIGQGYDVHRLVPGRRLVLGGVEIPSPVGLAGHSDADVLVHAVIDALLGSLALGDIGTLYPDTDPAYEGADSIELLASVAAILADRGATLVNADTTLIAQAPKIAPYVPQMCRRVADAMGVEPGAVSIKATTPERLGAFGREEGIAAQAVVLVRLADG